MLTFYDKYKGGDYSQNGESGIINECLKRIGLIKGSAVEFGAPTKEYCSNIFHLPNTFKKFWFDISPQEQGILKTEITPLNINEIIPDCNLLSIDIDGNDYAVWESYKGQPDIVIIEINSSFAPTVDHFSKNEGSSYRTMLKLGISKGYFLVCHTGNLIFVKEKYKGLFKEIPGNGVDNWQLYFNTSWLQ